MTAPIGSVRAGMTGHWTFFGCIVFDILLSLSNAAATGMSWVEAKMRELGVLSNPNYKGTPALLGTWCNFVLYARIFEPSFPFGRTVPPIDFAHATVWPIGAGQCKTMVLG
jgi:hypothetical protein